MNADVIVKGHLYSRDEGQPRNKPIPIGDFGCRFIFKELYYDCIVKLKKQWDFGADISQLFITFSGEKQIKSQLRPGSFFKLWKNGIIGEGKVLEVFDVEPDYEIYHTNYGDEIAIALSALYGGYEYPYYYFDIKIKCGQFAGYNNFCMSKKTLLSIIDNFNKVFKENLGRCDIEDYDSDSKISFEITPRRTLKVFGQIGGTHHANYLHFKFNSDKSILTTIVNQFNSALKIVI